MKDFLFCGKHVFWTVFITGLLLIFINSLQVMGQLSVMKDSWSSSFSKPVRIWIPWVDDSVGIYHSFTIFPLNKFSSILGQYGIDFHTTCDSYPDLSYRSDLSDYSKSFMILNTPVEGTSANKPMVIGFRRPVKGLVVRLGCTSKTVSFRAYNPSGLLLGEVNRLELAMEHGYIYFQNYVVETSHKEGIATLVVDYGEDESPEQIEEYLWVDYVEDSSFRTYLPQIAHVLSSEGILMKTDIRIQFPVGLPMTASTLKIEEKEIVLRFFDQKGEPMKIGFNGAYDSMFHLKPTTASYSLRADFIDSGNKIGWAEVESSMPVSVQAVYTTTASSFERELESSSPAVKPKSKQCIPVHRDKAKGTDTAIAVANVSQMENQLILTYGSEEGNDGRNVYLTLKPREQRAFFLSELPWPGDRPELKLKDPFRGALTIWGYYPIAVTALATKDGMPTYPLFAAGSED